MERRNQIIEVADDLFDRNGFAATGMDRLVRAAEMSSRTLYKHAGSKAELIEDVLRARDARFRSALGEAKSISGLFAVLTSWISREGARGCLFLRAAGEADGQTPAARAVIADHKAFLQHHILDLVAVELGRENQSLADQILLLFEGATAAAVYRGEDVVSAAGDAARQLLAAAKKFS